MRTLGIAAVMVHVDDVPAGLDWYRRAFLDARDVHIDATNFDCLAIGAVLLEIVPADEKVPSGARGVAVDWRVDELDDAIRHLEALGARRYRGPGAIEDGLRMCKMLDPWGNLIGLRGQ